MEVGILIFAVLAIGVAGGLRFTRKRREFIDEVNPAMYSQEYIDTMNQRVAAYRARPA